MRLGNFLLVTVCGFAVFALTMTFMPLMPARVNEAAHGALLLVLGLLWFASRGDRLGKYRPVFFAYFAAAVGLTLAYFGSDPLLAMTQLTIKTPMGVAVAKLLDATLIVIGVIATAAAARESLGSLYVRKGRLLLGLTFGLAGAAVFVALTFIPGGPFFQAASTAGGAAKLMPLVPWVLIFVLANAFMEELLFRGLVIGRLEPLMGPWLALISTALVFALAHMQVTYTAQVAGFVAFVFVLGLLWGFLMQKSRSIWGSVLFHAGADVAVILPIFQSMT